jgi:transposase
MGQETITLSKPELKKVLVVEKIIAGHMTNDEGAVTLGISVRQIIRLKHKYYAEGAPGLAHKNRGKTPSHALSKELKDRAGELYKSKYHGSNCCHFAELLEQHEGIQLSPSSVRRILLDQGLKQPKQRRRSKAHPPRERRSQAGMLWQIDATSFPWLEDRAPGFTLHAAIDDATGRMVGAIFRENECREGYSVVMQHGIQAYGVPLGLYSDRHTIFRSPKEKLTVEQELAGESQPLSHFGKAMADLHIEHIKATTPQAKGRVERLWGTLQDRWVIELRLLGIRTMEEANSLLPQLMQKYNEQFAVLPHSAEPAYRALPEDVNLDHVFSARYCRTLGPGHTISYGNVVYTFAERLPQRLQTKTVVEVRETLSGEVLIWYGEQAWSLKRTERLKPTPKEKAGSAQPRKPANSHPWKATYAQKQLKRNTKQSTFQDVMYSQHNYYSEAPW